MDPTTHGEAMTSPSSTSAFALSFAIDVILEGFADLALVHPANSHNPVAVPITMVNRGIELSIRTLDWDSDDHLVTAEMLTCMSRIMDGHHKQGMIVLPEKMSVDLIANLSASRDRLQASLQA